MCVVCCQLCVGHLNRIGVGQHGARGRPGIVRRRVTTTSVAPFVSRGPPPGACTRAPGGAQAPDMTTCHDKKSELSHQTGVITHGGCVITVTEGVITQGVIKVSTQEVCYHSEKCDNTEQTHRDGRRGYLLA